MKTDKRSLSVLRGLVGLVLLMAAGIVQAQTTISKANNTTALNDGASWTGGTAPTGVDTAQWEATVSGANSSALGGSVTWGQIQITNPGGAITIANTASAVLTLNGVGGTGIDMSAATQNLTINDPVTLGGAQTWTVASGRTLTIPVNYILDNGGYSLTIDVSGTISLGTINNSTATLTGSGSLTKSGAGRLNIGGVNNGFSGTVTINGGVMHVTNNNEPMGSGNLTLNGGVMSFYWGATYSRTLGTGNNQVQILGGSSGFAGAGTTGPTINLGAVVWGAAGEGAATGYFNPSTFVLGDEGTGNAASTTFSSAIDLNGATRTISVPYGTSANGNNSTISGAISTSSGTAGLTKTNDGNLVLSGNNTYNGPTTITAGTLSVNTSSRIGDGTAANTLIFNGGTLRATGTITSPSTRGVTMTSTGIIDNNGQAISIAGDIGGAGGLTKIGNGTLTLTGASTYTGTTTVSAGTLRVDSPGSLHASSTVSISGGVLDGTGTINGPVNVAVGGTLSSTTLTYGGLVTGTAGAAYLSPAGLGTLGTVTLGAGLTLNAGNAFECDLGTTSGSSDVIAITGDLVLNGTSYVAFNVPTGSAAANATYTIMTWSGSQTGGGTLVFPNGTSTMNGATLNIGATSVTITTDGSGITTGSRSVTWSGSPSYVWDSSTANWLDGATPTAYAYGDNVTFDDTGLAVSPVTGTPASPASVTINTSSKTYTISASIGGSGGLTKSGTSTLTLSGANTYTGDITASGGTVTFSVLNAWGGTGKNLTLSGDVIINSSTTGYNGGQLVVNGGVTGTFAGQSINFGSATGSGTVVFRGANGPMLTISDGSNFTGNLFNIISFGTNPRPQIRFASLNDAVGSSLQFGGGQGDSNQWATFALYGNGGTVTFNNRQIQMLARTSGNNDIRTAILNNNNTITDHKWVINTDFLNTTAAGTRNLQLGGSNVGDNEFHGVIGDGASTLNLLKADAGKWILSGNNTYSGITTVSGGTLVLKGGQAISDSGTVNIAGGRVELVGHEMVAALQFDGAGQASGTWGSTSSAAVNKNDTRFVGTGILYVGEPMPDDGVPVVGNGDGATSASVTSATIRGMLTDGGQATGWICWGASEGGTNSIDDWENVVPMGDVYESQPFSTQVTGLYTNTTYRYRCYVTNDYGYDWSDAELFNGTPHGAVGNGAVGISYHPITGDGDSGISSNKTYTHVVDFGTDATRALINGVQFQAGGTTFGAKTGTSATIGTGSTTISTAHAGDASANPYLNGASACAMEGLVKDMNYDNAAGTVTLTGLTPGQRYQFRLYNRQWGATAGSNRGQDIGFDTDGIGTAISGAEHTATFQADDASQPDPGFGTFSQVYALTYDYTLSPGVTSLKVYINRKAGHAGTYHMYGLSNEEIDADSIKNLAPTNITESVAHANATLNAASTNCAVYIHWGTSDGGTNFGGWSKGYAYVGSWTNVASTNINYLLTGLRGGSTNYYTFRGSNEAGNVWSAPSWRFITLPSTGAGSVFMFK